MSDDEIPHAFPLAWPIGRVRHKHHEPSDFRHAGRRLTTAQGLARLQVELVRIGAKAVVISTNVPVGVNGLPYSNVNPADPGVAVWFQLVGEPHVLSCDRWDRPADNLAAIAKHIEAIRGTVRWGSADIKQSFGGFKTLPASAPEPPWWKVLEFSHPPTTIDDVKRRFRELAARYHPDRQGGDHARMAAVSAAYESALEMLGERTTHHAR